MPTSLSKSITILDKVYRNPAFLQEIEDHLPYFVQTGKYNEMGVDPAQALQYSGDFNGLMQALGFHPRTYYINMRLSGLSNPQDYRGDQITIRVVDQGYYSLFVNTWRVHRRQK